MPFRLQGTYTVTIDALFPTIEGARAHEAAIEEEHANVNLTLTEVEAAQPDTTPDPTAL